jgi:hypothetical protein
MMLWIEGAIALTITAGFVISSFFMFKPAHVEHHPLRVRIGAGIQGLVIGLLVAFVIVPVRVSMMEGAASPNASLSVLPAILLLIVIRRGALLRAPVIKTYLRAYRRAMLLRTLDETQKQLTRLDKIEGRAAA